MANPALVKAAVRAAITVITDEKARRRVIMLAIAPLAGLLLLVSLFFYILTMPLQLLCGFFTGDTLTAAADVRITHGYDQYIDPASADYLDHAGLDFSGVSFTDSATAVHYFNQLDARWKDLPYGVTSTIGEAGCGPTALAMAVSSLTDTTVDPIQMSAWAYQNGYLCEGSGSYHRLIPNGAVYFGLTVESAAPSDPQAIVDALANGKLVIAIMGKGHFTTSGHYIVLRGVTETGKVLVADPASVRRSEQEWDLSIIIAEARRNAAAGGPFWVLGASP